MKKGLIYILIVLIVIGAFAPTHFVQAQTETITNIVVSGIAGAAGRVVSPILSFVFYLIQKITALFMGLSGLILNYTIDITVVRMAQNISGMTGINIAWRVIRDLMNMGFIFILIYEGILLIIGQSDTGKIRRFIVGIILASVLINFSLFFTKVIIDASNVVTIGLYNSIMANTPNAGTGNGSGLSNAFQQSLGLQGFFSTNTIPVSNTSGDYGQLVANLMGALLFLVTAFVFLAVSIMFVIRYIVLIILLALSPVAYMGMALDGIKKYSNQWWDSLWGQVLFAPVYMLMTWVTLIIMRSPGFLGVNQAASSWAGLSNVFSGPDVAGSVSLLFNFALVIGLTIASLVVAKSFATRGAKQIGTMIGGATAFAGGTLVGSAAWAGRRTLGQYAYNKSTDENLQKRAERGDRVAKIQLATSKYVAGSSFDARRGYVGEKITESLGGNFGKGVPFKEKAGEGGRAKLASEREEKARKEIDRIIKRDRSDPSALAAYVATRSIVDQDYVYDKLSARDRAALEEQLNARGTSGSATATRLRNTLSVEDREKTDTASRDSARDAQNRTIRQNIHDMATDPALLNPTSPTFIAPPARDTLVRSLRQNQASRLSHEARMHPEVISRLSTRQLGDLMSNGNLTDDEIRAIRMNVTDPGVQGWMSDPVRANDWMDSANTPFPTPTTPPVPPGGGPATSPPGGGGRRRRGGGGGGPTPPPGGPTTPPPGGGGPTTPPSPTPPGGGTPPTGGRGPGTGGGGPTPPTGGGGSPTPPPPPPPSSGGGSSGSGGGTPPAGGTPSGGSGSSTPPPVPPTGNSTRSSNESNDYQTLGVRRGASNNEMRQAWMKQIAINHPDNYESQIEKEAAQRRIEEINRAFNRVQLIEGNNRRAA